MEVGQVVLSSDDRVLNISGCPADVACEFCGEVRYTKGVVLRVASPIAILWLPSGADPCACPEGKLHHETLKDELEKKREAAQKKESVKEMQKRVSKLIGESGMAERFLQKTFHSFVADTPERKKTAAAAMAYARNFERLIPKRGEEFLGRNGLVISGTKGTGKTHIAAAIANYLLNKGIAVICMTERNLLGEIQHTYSNSVFLGVGRSSESIIRKSYEMVPLLIIDDLGKERPTEWTLATLYAIIDGRYAKGMPTIITTNYDKESLISRLTPAGSDKVTADAILDRLDEMCDSIGTIGESWRSKL